MFPSKSSCLSNGGKRCYKGSTNGGVLFKFEFIITKSTAPSFLLRTLGKPRLGKSSGNMTLRSRVTATARPQRRDGAVIHYSAAVWAAARRISYNRSARRWVLSLALRRPAAGPGLPVGPPDGLRVRPGGSAARSGCPGGADAGRRTCQVGPGVTRTVSKLPGLTRGPSLTRSHGHGTQSDSKLLSDSIWRAHWQTCLAGSEARAPIEQP